MGKSDDMNVDVINVEEQKGGTQDDQDKKENQPKCTIVESLNKNVRLIEEAVKQKEPKLISSRLLRQTQALKKDLTAQGIVDFVKSWCLLPRVSENGDDDDVMATAVDSVPLSRIQGLLGACSSFGDGQELDWSTPLVSDDLTAEQSKNNGKKDTSPSSNVNIQTEIELYVYVVSSMYLVQKKAWPEVMKVCQAGIDVVTEYNSRIIDSLGAKLYSYMSLAAENMGVLVQIRGVLLQLHRTAVLRHDAIGQETLLNLLLRNYLAYKLYNQAEALRAKAQPDVYKSSAQHCRLLYYHGRIQAVLLEYSDAKEALVQASRKAPQSATGFRLEVAKWLVVVRLLLGEVPNRAELAPADVRNMMKPYYELARAVGAGDVSSFDSIAEMHHETFDRDDLKHLVARLRANVIRSGVRRIATAYSRISLSDISNKLGIANVSDTEYIVAKAIRDGGIVAELDHETGIMTCSSVSDVYSTDEPLNAFHARIAFCLDIHNEAYKAIRHDPQKKKWNDDATSKETVSIEDALEAFFDD